MKALRIAIIGATGHVGRKVVEQLLDWASPDQLLLYASPRSHGTTLCIRHTDFLVKQISCVLEDRPHLVIFNTESDVSAQWIPELLRHRAYVIDSSSHYRLAPEVPLIVPPVNSHLIQRDTYLYAHANCLASPAAVVISALTELFDIARIQATTYQSVSGAGKRASDECFNETKCMIQQESYERTIFKRRIAFNVIPQVGCIQDDGYTSEEVKIMKELQKILQCSCPITATAVRVPVLQGHCIALHLQLRWKENPELKWENSTCFTEKSMAAVLSLLTHQRWVRVWNDYPTPADVVDTDEVHVGRMRPDLSMTDPSQGYLGIHLWLCSDNLRRGAATDAAEIAYALKKIIMDAAFF